MKQVKIEGLTELEKRIERLAKWSEKDSVKLRQIDERVANVYNTALRANIKDADNDIYVYRKNRGRGRNPGSITGERKGVRQIIKSGALRRSIKVFRRSNKAITLAGPKTRGRRGGTTKTNRQDGWFASIVENGSGFGAGRNKGVFTRTQRATNQRMRSLRLKLLQQEFKRYMK